MENVLKQVFGRKEAENSFTLKDMCKPLLIPCFDLKSSTSFVFSRADRFHFTSIDGKTSYSTIDDGLVMSNTAAAAVTHVLHNKRDFSSVNNLEDLFLLLIGNIAQAKKVWDVNECSTSSVVDIAINGVSETVDQMLWNNFCWNRTNYVRIQKERENTPDRNHGSLTEQRRQSARLPPPTTNLVFASPPNCATFGSDSSWPCGRVTEDRSVGSELPHGATPTTVSTTKVFHHLLNFFPRI
ncbi:hypothetical protein PIB30_063816 [Stylosanthes scabra]|uniref:Uncharacterized protein n=1 Tax=Stylosanthes scabra TaxID=79078 RepID=A0ABU6ZKD0_9FABA|nr:hypothetical protein [Stylosanthes scabra]